MPAPRTDFNLLGGRMNRASVVTDHLADLLAYYPGRGRLALVWLLLVPVGAAVIASHTLVQAKLSSFDTLPYYVYLAAGQSVMWLYVPAVLACLLKSSYSRTTSVSRTAAIVLSSSLYGLAIGIPAVAVAALWSTHHVGLSPRAVATIPAGLLVTGASALLVVAGLGLLARRFNLLVPLLLLLAATYRTLMPVTYSLSVVPDDWRILAFAGPLVPETAILRNALLDRAGDTPSIFWVAALAHTAMGFVVSVWLWGRIAEDGAPGET